ncbi:MAG: hypothetical protein PHR68_01415, partial [Candidatus Gracilibacteria bacterium]|nr:hypothetical protein [Candidatus Gracilibacteria bacterium]
KLEIKEKIETQEDTLREIKEYKDTIVYQKSLKKELEGLGETDINSKLRISEIKSQLNLIEKYINFTKERYHQIEEESFEEKTLKKLEDLKNEEKELDERYTKEIKDLYEKSGNKVKENDEKTRETLNILDSIGFTLIPKNITDDIIATINKNPANYGFDSRIDLKNGNFGGINNDLTKIRFIKKINKMLSSKETEPIGNDEIDNIIVKKVEKDKDSQEEKNKELLGKFSKYGIINDLGIWDKEKLESNLTLKEKQETQKETK